MHRYARSDSAQTIGDMFGAHTRKQYQCQAFHKDTENRR